MKTVALMLIVAASPLAALAEPLADPMRPPMSSAVAAASPAAERPGLQFVLISDARRIAVIDGREVSIGDRVRGAEVVDIRETEVTLKTGTVRQVLQLNSTAVAKQVRAPRDGASEPVRHARAEVRKEALR